MEDKLKLLFDYQRFEQLPQLERLIKQTENRRRRELSEDDLLLVTAAGDLLPDYGQHEKFADEADKKPL